MQLVVIALLVVLVVVAVIRLEWGPLVLAAVLFAWAISWPELTAAIRAAHQRRLTQRRLARLLRANRLFEERKTLCAVCNEGLPDCDCVRQSLYRRLRRCFRYH